MINVKYTSSSRSPSGYGEAARNFITALFCSGVNLTTENLMQMAEKTNYGITGAICDSLEGRRIPYKITIVHLTPDLIPQYQEKGIYTISHLFWETDSLPKEWITPLNNIDEIWTGSSKMSEMIKASGVTTPCYFFPQPINTGLAEESIDPFVFTFPKDFVFYTIGQWIDRKNMKGLLRAYWKAFEGKDNVSLLLKTYRVNYTDSEYKLIKNDIIEWKNELKLKHFPKVLLTKNLLTENQISKLHLLGDCYVSPSSGEGWNRPLQEAALFGNPIVSADNGGITDYLTDQHYFRIASNLSQATEQTHIPWYKSSMKWKLIDEYDLVKQMKIVFNDFEKAKLKGRTASEYVKKNFSYRIVGDLMKKRLEEINL